MGSCLSFIRSSTLSYMFRRQKTGNKLSTDSPSRKDPSKSQTALKSFKPENEESRLLGPEEKGAKFNEIAEEEDQSDYSPDQRSTHANPFNSFHDALKENAYHRYDSKIAKAASQSPDPKLDPANTNPSPDATTKKSSIMKAVFKKRPFASKPKIVQRENSTRLRNASKYRSGLVMSDFNPNVLTPENFEVDANYAHGAGRSGR